MFPCDEIYPSVVAALLDDGRTIRTIEANERGGRPAKGDRSQAGWRDKPVWHTKKSVDLYVADRLKLDPSVWGPDRPSNDFQDSTAAAIMRLRKEGRIVDLAKGRRQGIYRLADGHGLGRPSSRMTLEKRVDGPPEARWRRGPYTDEDRMGLFMRILDRGAKDGTYKFALARALIEICGERDARAKGPYIVPYEELAMRFLRYYWRQECIFHIRQNFEGKPEAGAIRAIREMWGDRSEHDDFGELDEADVQEVRDRILRDVFGSARAKRSVVVPRFQRIKVGACTEEIQMFYSHDGARREIAVDAYACGFFRRHGPILQSAVMHRWARYLERTNGGLPSLIAKIESARTRPARNAAYMRMARDALLVRGATCFYCRCLLDERTIRPDHVIPWSFIFDDQLWNLVPSCDACNRRKSNSLPDRRAYDRLVRRNRKPRKIRRLPESLRQLDRGEGWKKAMDGHYRACMEQGFAVMTAAEIREGRRGGDCGRSE